VKLLIQKTKEHLKSQNETYLQHMCAAWKIVYLLKTLELKCLIHSIVPGLYTEAVSEKIECLQKLLKRDKNETPP
jgi:hypothetical protein